MGYLFYGSTTEPIEIPDRVLAHLKVVATTKLRRAESFTLSWRHATGTTPGRTTIWLQPSIPLLFRFESEQPEALNPAALKEMANQANSSGGLSIDLDAEIPDAAAAPRPVVAPARRTAAARVGVAA